MPCVLHNLCLVSQWKMTRMSIIIGQPEIHDPPVPCVLQFEWREIGGGSCAYNRCVTRPARDQLGVQEESPKVVPNVDQRKRQINSLQISQLGAGVRGRV